MERRQAKEMVTRVKLMLSFLEDLETAFPQHHVDSHQSWGSKRGGRAFLLMSRLCSYPHLGFMLLSPTNHSPSWGQSGDRAGWRGSSCRTRMSPQRSTMTGRG